MVIQITYLELLNKYKKIDNILNKNIQLDILQTDLFKEIKSNIINKLKNAKINEEIGNEFVNNYINYLNSNHLYDLKEFLINAKNSIGAPLFSKNEINILFSEYTISSILFNINLITKNTLNNNGTNNQFKAVYLYLYYIFNTITDNYINIAKQLVRLQNNYNISLKDYNLSPYTDEYIILEAKNYINSNQYKILDKFLLNAKNNFKDSTELYNKLFNLLKETKNLKLLQFYTDNIEKDLIIKKLLRNINKIKESNYSLENLEYLNKLNLNPININQNSITKYIKSDKVQLSDVFKLKNILEPKPKIGSFDIISKNIIIFIIISIIILLLLLLIFLSVYMIYKTIKNSKCINYFYKPTDQYLYSNISNSKI